MELITEKPVKQFDTSAIAKGNLIYAKHSSWDAGKSGFVTGVNGNEIAVQFHPGIGNVTNHFFILASEAAAGQWEIRWSVDMSEVLLYQMDAADNLFPSIHCLNSWFCYIAVRSRREIPRWYQRFSFWAALAVFVSTLTTKQHVIADVIGGALLAEVTWQIAGRTHLGAWYGMILERRRWKRRAE